MRFHLIQVSKFLIMENYFSDKDKSKENSEGFQHEPSNSKLPPLNKTTSTARHFSSSSSNSAAQENALYEKEGGMATKGLLPTFKALRDRKTNFVFLFGRPGSGKTAIISSVCHYLSTHPSGSLEVRNKSNREGMFFLKEIFRKGKEGLFLERTARNKITEIDLMYTPRKPKKSMNLTFLEMSGEDLSKVELKRDYQTGNTAGGLLPDNIDVYLKCPKIKMVFLLVTEWKNAREDDILMFEFLDYLRKKQKSFQKPQVLLLVSKWDTYGGKYRKDIDAFAREHMKLTYNLLTQIEGSLTFFTVGEVVEVENEYATDTLISSVDTTQADVVKRWVYNAVTGKVIPKEGESWWNRMMDSLNA